MIELKNISKNFGERNILKDFNLKILPGEMVAIIGKSGSGKSTLLNILGLIENYDSGTYTLFDMKNIKVNSKKSEIMIRDKISYLFQNFALIENETVKQNLEIALKYYNGNKLEKKETISDSLIKVGLKDYENKKIFELSGGEQQRVALARAMIKPSEIILADEPTGSLDADNRDEVLSILKDINKSGKIVIIVTHDPAVSSICSRVISI